MNQSYHSSVAPKRQLRVTQTRYLRLQSLLEKVLFPVLLLSLVAFCVAHWTESPSAELALVIAVLAMICAAITWVQATREKTKLDELQSQVATAGEED